LRHTGLVGGLLGLLLVGGCLGRGDFTPIRYYSVDSLPVSVAPAARSWPIPLGVRPFTAATRYRDRILYRLSAVEVGFYQYDRWVEPPEEMVTRVLIAALSTSGLFRQVVPVDVVQLPAWLLSGELIRFDEVRDAGGSRAECWVRVEVQQAHDERLLWTDVLKATEPLAAETPEALARAMSRAVQQVAVGLIARLEQAVLPLP
jgi:ABC-type uncharacterized transport system auxiliary subunit